MSTEIVGAYSDIRWMELLARSVDHNAVNGRWAIVLRLDLCFPSDTMTA
jgi:hypothetical protein